MTDQIGNVAGPFPQWRDADWENIESKEKVLSEAAGADLGREIPVRGRYDPHIHPDRLAAADSFDDAFLEDTEEQRLCLWRQFADFVQEDGTSMRQLEPAVPPPGGAGERPRLMPEKFTGDNTRCQGGAVDGDKRVVLARAELMHGPSNKLFTGPSLAENQHRGVGGGDAADGLTDGGHCRPIPGQRAKVVTGAGLVAQISRLALEPLKVSNAGDQFRNPGISFATSGAVGLSHTDMLEREW
jgi:hypothetical protein